MTVADDSFAGYGETYDLIRSYDWSQTPVGTIAEWSQSLRTAISICLTSPHPIEIWWGKDYTRFYNDACWAILGQRRHPHFLGCSARGCWADIWHQIQAAVQHVWETGESVRSDNMRISVHTNGCTREAYVNFGFSPIYLEPDHLGGIFCTIDDVTAQVINDQRLQTLRQLVTDTTTAETVESVCAIATQILTNNSVNVPFSLLYLLTSDGQQAYLAGATGIATNTIVSPQQIEFIATSQTVDHTIPDTCWHLEQVYRTRQSVFIENITNVLEINSLGIHSLDNHANLQSDGATTSSITTAMVFPLLQAGYSQPMLGFLILGINAQHEFDEQYQTFFDLIAGHIATAIANVSTYKALQVAKNTTLDVIETAQAEVFNVLESITNAFITCDRAWRITYVNHQATQLFQQSRPALLGKNVQHDLLPAFAKSVSQWELERALAEQVEVQFEDYLPEFNRWIDVHAYPSNNGLSICLRDISDLKQNQIIREQNEIRLEEHQHLLQQVTDTVPGILYVYDLVAQQNVYVNGQVSDMLGYTPAQVQSMGVSLFLRLVHPDDLAKFSQHVQRFTSLQDGEILENEYRMRTATGEWRWFSGREIVFSRTPNGLPKQILGSAYDITDRKQMEAALRREKERFELAASAVDCLIYDWSIDTQIVERSEGLTRIFGYLPEETEPTRDWWSRQIHPDDLPLAQAQVAADLANHNRYAIEYRIRNKYNQYLYVLDQGFVIRDDNGQPIRVVGTTTNISDRKITEKVQQFLIELNDEVRVIGDPQAIMQTAVNKLGSYFNVTRCIYGEMDSNDNYATVNCDFCNGVSSIIGKHRLDEFGAPIVSLLKQGKTLIVEDTATDPRTSNVQLAFDAIQTRASLCVPLIKQERIIAFLALQHHQPRTWSIEEITLLEEAVDRTWEAIDKARAETALRQSEARFQRLATNVPGAICRYLLHPDGSDAMPYISPSCRTLFELEATTVQEDVNALWALLWAEDLQALREIIANSAATQQPIHWEGRCQLRSGTTKWIQLVARPERQTDRSILWDGLLTDITGTKEVELEREQLLTRLQQYADQLRGLTEAALAMNSVLSVEEVLQVITEQAHTIIGTHLAVTSLVENQDWENAIHARYLSEKYATWRDQNHQLDGSGMYADICQQNQPIRMTQAELDEHPTYGKFQQTNQQAGQSHPPLRGWLAAPLMGRNGQNIGLIQLSDRNEGDFTQSDEDILVQLAQMASVAIENTRLYTAEQQARTHAEAANRIKDEFLAVLSHELRSPLNPILGWSRLMRHRQLDQTTTAAALETIERNAKLQTQLIEDLLDVSRILQGKMSLNISAVDLIPTIEAALETVQLAAEAKSIQISSTFDPKIGQVLGDTNRLQQVVWNLLSNAVKFTPDGGQVSISLTEITASSNISQPVPYAQIRVTDTGKGIEPTFLPHVFEYFRQEDGAITRKFGGLGLGLAIVRHIVELHGGSIQADSAGVGRGASFTVKLPLLRPEPVPMTDARQSDVSTLDFPTLPLKNRHILVVDDEADSREFIVYVLKQAGAQVTAATSAKEALVALTHTPIDVLVSDIGMPEVDGYMLIRQVRSHFSKSKQTIPAIALTAYAGDSDRRQATDAGFQHHLTKPIEPTELIETVANYCN